MNVEISRELFDASRPHLCHLHWSPDFLWEEDWNVAQKYRIPGKQDWLFEASYGL